MKSAASAVTIPKPKTVGAAGAITNTKPSIKHGETPPETATSGNVGAPSPTECSEDSREGLVAEKVDGAVVESFAIDDEGQTLGEGVKSSGPPEGTSLGGESCSFGYSRTEKGASADSTGRAESARNDVREVEAQDTGDEGAAEGMAEGFDTGDHLEEEHRGGVATGADGGDDVGRREEGEEQARHAIEEHETEEEALISPNVPGSVARDEVDRNVLDAVGHEGAEAAIDGTAPGVNNANTERYQDGGDDAEASMADVTEVVREGMAKEQVDEESTVKATFAEATGVAGESQAADDVPVDDGAHGIAEADPVEQSDGRNDCKSAVASTVVAAGTADTAGAVSPGTPVDVVAVSQSLTESLSAREYADHDAAEGQRPPEVEAHGVDDNCARDRESSGTEVVGEQQSQGEGGVPGPSRDRLGEVGTRHMAAIDSDCDNIDSAHDVGIKVEADSSIIPRKDPAKGLHTEESLADFDPGNRDTSDFFAGGCSSDENQTGPPESTSSVVPGGSGAKSSSGVGLGDVDDDDIDNTALKGSSNLDENDESAGGVDRELYDPPSPRLISSTFNSPGLIGRGTYPSTTGGAIGAGFVHSRSPAVEAARKMAGTELSDAAKAAVAAALANAAAGGGGGDLLPSYSRRRKDDYDRGEVGRSSEGRSKKKKKSKYKDEKWRRKGSGDAEAMHAAEEWGDESRNRGGGRNGLGAGSGEVPGEKYDDGSNGRDGKSSSKRRHRKTGV